MKLLEHTVIKMFIRISIFSLLEFNVDGASSDARYNGQREHEEFQHRIHIYILIISMLYKKFKFSNPHLNCYFY